MLVASFDLTNVLDTLIITLPAIIAALYAARIHSAVKTPSGDSIGKVVERAHETSVANNMLLRAANGETHEAKPGELSTEAHTPPSVPTPAPETG